MASRLRTALNWRIKTPFYYGWLILAMAFLSAFAAPGVTQVVLLPVAWTIGTDFKPAPRRPASEIVWFDQWGYTHERPGEESSLLATAPGVTVEIDIAAPPERIWELVSDINIPARFSNEFQGADWIDADGPREGLRSSAETSGKT